MPGSCEDVDAIATAVGLPSSEYPVNTYQLLQAVLAEQAPEAADLSGVTRQPGLVVVHAAEELPLHVLGPVLDQFFVAEV